MEDTSELQPKEKIGRRGFLKSAGLLLGVGALSVAGVETYRRNEDDPFKYDNFKELVGREPKLYSGYFMYFEGQVKLKEGTKFYSKATHEEKVLRESRSTYLGEIEKGQELIVKNPLIITSEADNLTDENWRMKVSAPVNKDGDEVGEDKEINFLATWIAFSLEGSGASPDLVKKAKDQPESVIFVRVADSMPALDFLPLGETEPGHVIVPSEALVQANPLAIKRNGKWDLNNIAREDDRQSPWFGPVSTSEGRYLEVGMVSKGL